MGLLLNLPNGSNSGQTHTIIDIYRVVRLYERNGHLYFQIRDENGLVIVSTEGSGLNFCSGLTYYVKVYRNSDSTQHKIGIEVFDKCNYEINFSTIDLTFDTELVLGAQDVDNGYASNLVHNSYLSGFFLVRGLLTKDDDIAYWLRGEPLVGTQVFLRLDENAGIVILDSSGFGNTGYIDGYSSECRGVHDRFFSWQNFYGFSTGAHVKTLLPLLDLDDNALVPSLMRSKKTDIYGNDLEYAGRIRMAARIEDIATLKADGVVWGRVSNPQKLQLRPGQDKFSIVGVFERTDISTGVIMSVGDRYRIEFSGTGKLTVSLGGQISDVSVPIGVSVYMLNVGLTTCEVWVNNVLLATLPVGSVYSGGGYADFLSVGGGSVLNDGVVAFLGVREGTMTESERNTWFEHLKLEGTYRAAYYFYSFINKIFDVSGYLNHMDLIDYSDTVWSGRQSVMPYLVGGFTELYSDRENLLNPIVVPFDKNGTKISWNVYGSGQVEIEYEDKGGLLLFDAYINFNPYGKVLGFWTRFWDKTKPEFWGALDARFLDPNPLKWNIQELTMDYLVQSLNPISYNYVFSGGRTGHFGFTVELVDLVLLNLGNNIINKPIPI